MACHHRRCYVVLRPLYVYEPWSISLPLQEAASYFDIFLTFYILLYIEPIYFR